MDSTAIAGNHEIPRLIGKEIPDSDYGNWYGVEVFVTDVVVIN